MRTFITFEGIEGSGKTTQIQLLSEKLDQSGVEHVLTREPGGTPVGNQIRRLLLDPANRDLNPLCELLLYQAARAQHLACVIIPALAEGKMVLCDRYKDATRAYQGKGRHLPEELVEMLNRVDLLALEPDLTLLFDLEPDEALSRARQREGSKPSEQSRFEEEAMDFHQRVREAYRSLAAAYPQRIRVVDASGTMEQVQERVLAVLKKNFPSMKFA